MIALQKLGLEVLAVPKTKPGCAKWQRLWLRILGYLGYPPDFSYANRSVIEAAATGKYHVLWVDCGHTIRARTLREARRLCPRLTLVHYSSDDAFGAKRNAFRRFRGTIRHYDVHFVPTDANLWQYRLLGAAKVFRLQRGFCPDVHRPMALSKDERDRFRSEILFIGHWEPKRESDIASLIHAGLPVRVFGLSRQWRRGRHWRLIKPHFVPHGVWGDDYARALSACKIALCFLSEWNNDLVNSRMFEIPACRAFMLCERNQENVRVFADKKEAAYFSSQTELIEKARYYLINVQERERIARAGFERCYRGNCDYVSRMHWMLYRVGVIDRVGTVPSLPQMFVEP